MDDRTIGYTYLINKCIEKYGNQNIKNIRFNINDRGNENKDYAEYSMCYNKNKPELEKYCGPDFNFYAWSQASIHSFEDTKNAIIEMANKPPTVNKVGWYGNIYSPLPDVIEYKTRPLLHEYGFQYPDLLDIFHVSPNNGIIDNNVTNYITLPELMKYRYLIDIGGNGWSGRLKFLLFSKRPLLIVDRVYIDYFHKDLIPYHHYIPVKTDLSDLLEQIDWIKQNEEKSLEIANNAFNYAVDNFTIDRLIERVYYVYGNIVR